MSLKWKKLGVRTWYGEKAKVTKGGADAVHD